MDGNNSPATTKGYGLKKWRRIPRDAAVREAPSSSADSVKAVVLKRLLSGPVAASAAAESETSSKSSTAASAPPKPIVKKLAHAKKPRGDRRKPNSGESNGDANGHDHHHVSDPLRHSLLSLQSLHDALATEVEKFGAMGTEPVLSVDKVKGEESFLRDKVTSLQRDVEALEAKLAETNLDALFTARIAAEIEFLTISMAAEGLKAVAGKQESIFKELECAAEEQAQTLTRLGQTVNKAAKLEEEARELGEQRDEMVKTEEVIASRRRVDKLSLCFLAQLVLFVFVVWSFASQISSPRSRSGFGGAAVVPT